MPEHPCAGVGPAAGFTHGARRRRRHPDLLHPRGPLVRDNGRPLLFQRYPAVPASLVLIGGYAGWAGSLPTGEVARRLEMFLGMADLGDAFDPKSYPGLFTDLIPADRNRVLATMMRENMRPASVRAAGYIGAETDLRPVLPTVDVPTLVLHGEADARSPLASAETLHAAISTSQLVVLPTLGHACVAEDPDACSTAIRR